jgi:hypothetical protein
MSKYRDFGLSLDSIIVEGSCILGSLVNVYQKFPLNNFHLTSIQDHSNRVSPANQTTQTTPKSCDAGLDPCKCHHGSNPHKFSLYGKDWNVGIFTIINSKANSCQLYIYWSIHAAIKLIQLLNYEMYCDFQQDKIETKKTPPLLNLDI